MRKVESVCGENVNAEFATFDAVKDPNNSRRDHRSGLCNSRISSAVSHDARLGRSAKSKMHGFMCRPISAISGRVLIKTSALSSLLNCIGGVGLGMDFLRINRAKAVFDEIYDLDDP